LINWRRLMLVPQLKVLTMTANLSYFNENGSFVSALGQSRRFETLSVRPGLPFTADILATCELRRDGP